MQHTVKHLPENMVEIAFTLTPEEMQPHLEDAAKRISETVKIPGFRPGHASYQVVVGRVGEMKVLEEALETIVRKSYVEVVLAEQLETLGAPRIDVEKLAPGNPVVFKTTVALMPAIKKLADYHAMRVSKKSVTVPDEEVGRVLRDIQKMQTRETRENRPTTKTDRVVLDLDISHNKVAIEGGSTKGHSVLMDEDYYIPGFTEAILGMKEEEEKTFTLSFPETHYQKMLAGKPAEFRVVIREIYRRDPPALDDVLAKSLGKETLKEVEGLLRTNLEREKAGKEEERVELEILESIVNGSDFEDIPTLLVNEETERMRHELERNVAAQGLEWNDYLARIKKTEPELRLDFAPQAVRRVKTALVVREIAKKENIEVSAAEIDTELDQAASFYKDDPGTRERMYSPEYRDEFTHMLKNRKTIARLKERILKK